MEERRRLRRRSLVAEVGLRLKGEGEWMEAVLMNINRGGLGVYTPAEIGKKARVVVRITYKDGQKRATTEEIPGIIQWVQKIGSQNAAGIMFLDRINRRNFPILSKCLDYARNSK